VTWLITRRSKETPFIEAFPLIKSLAVEAQEGIVSPSHWLA
jgi:hypothetical protein